ncbi:MAG: IS110 family transposase [Mesorhizobium sp.]|nr:MAG: IS110 family transposase [Mesorhizobium sp.]
MKIRWQVTPTPGIGPVNALTIIAEAGDLRRFHHHRQFLKFCGLDLSTRPFILARMRVLAKLCQLGRTAARAG